MHALSVPTFSQAFRAAFGLSCVDRKTRQINPSWFSIQRTRMAKTRRVLHGCGKMVSLNRYPVLIGSSLTSRPTSAESFARRTSGPCWKEKVLSASRAQPRRSWRSPRWESPACYDAFKAGGKFGHLFTVSAQGSHGDDFRQFAECAGNSTESVIPSGKFPRKTGGTECSFPSREAACINHLPQVQSELFS